jgi:TolA-binding protein
MSGNQRENIMKSCTDFRWLLTLALVGAIAWVGCAGSKSDSTIAEGAGSYTDTTKSESTPSRSSDEAEVLRLLGISKTEEGADKTTAAAEPDTQAKISATDVEHLSEEAKAKDDDVAALKAELAERDRRIASLQEQIDKNGSEPAPAAPLVAGSFKERYEAARKLYEEKKYRQAAAIFEKLVQSGGDKSLLDNCQYWVGECYYGINYYNQAIVEFEKVFTYSDTDKYDDSQLKLGFCYLRIGNVDRAKSELEKLIVNYPESEYVQRAREYLARL